MARLPYVDLATASEEVRTLFGRMPVHLNIFRMTAHAQTNFRAMLRFGNAILVRQKLDGKLRELAILRVAKLSGARYEWVQHVPIAEAAGASAEQIAALDGDTIDAPSFSVIEQLVLRFTTEVVREVGASDTVVAEMTQYFSPQEIIELLFAIGFYMMMARIMETCAVDLEPAAGMPLFRTAR
jgi:AhpD family alkylhydroperoxidase